jgi:ribosomal-protein-alanine N-acetyltransferase
MVISPLVIADIPAVLAIENHSQPEPWTERSFLEEIDRLNSSVLVARLGQDAPETGLSSPPGGGIAGYICFWCIADEIQVLNIAVHKDFRRRGVGRALLECAIRAGQFRNAACVNLEVRQSNAEARGLYESSGFKVVGKRPNYYGDSNEPAILMELQITRKG